MLELHNVKVQLQNNHFTFSLQARPAQTVAILGKSGAGKSTLLSVIAGFINASSGNITWQGQSIQHLPPDLRPVTSLFQANNLFDHLNVADNIGFGLDSGLKLTASDRKKLGAVLEKVGLAGFEARYPKQLSGGEQQRVALARCLLRQQPILLLDEPFSALDQQTRESMLELTRSIAQSESLCTLLVTHNEDDARAMQAEVKLMESGQLGNSD